MSTPSTAIKIIDGHWWPELVVSLIVAASVFTAGTGKLSIIGHRFEMFY
jgi:hypothetical protein